MLAVITRRVDAAFAGQGDLRRGVILREIIGIIDGDELSIAQYLKEKYPNLNGNFTIFLIKPSGRLDCPQSVAEFISKAEKEYKEEKRKLEEGLEEMRKPPRERKMPLNPNGEW